MYIKPYCETACSLMARIQGQCQRCRGGRDGQAVFAAPASWEAIGACGANGWFAARPSEGSRCCAADMQTPDSVGVIQSRGVSRYGAGLHSITPSLPELLPRYQ